MVDNNGEFNPKVRRIFEELFDKFAVDGYMDPESTAKYTWSCTDDGCGVDDTRVKSLFRTYDLDWDNRITKDEFIQFYHDASVKKPPVVWSNIYNHNYNNAFEKITPSSYQNSD